MRALLLFGLCLLVTACIGVEMKQGSKPMARREIPPGPGLLTGSQGEFVIFRLEEPSAGQAPAGSPPKDGEASQ